MPAPLVLTSADDARRLLAEVPPLAAEDVPLAAADGRVLAADFVAPEDHPALARGVMDGYAVRAADTAGASEAAPVSLRVAGAVPMGDVWSGAVAAGDAVAIATGGVLPAGADAVVMVEHTRRDGDRLAILRAAAPGQHVLRPGDDVPRGERLLLAGRRLRPQDVAALAAFGVTTVRAHRRPRVAIVSTGSEIVPPEVTPRPGQVRDMNQLALAAQAARAGATVTLGGIVADDVAALRAATAALVADHDMVLLSGGSSIGARDLTAGVLEAIGARVVFHGIDVRPGKPTIFARLGDRPILGMPGVPASAMIIFDLFVAPLVRRLGGERVDPDRAWPARGRARLTRRVPSVVGREDVVRVRLRPAPDAPDAWLAEPLLGGNAAVATLVRADGLVIVPAASDALAEGADVDVLLYA